MEDGDFGNGKELRDVGEQPLHVEHVVGEHCPLDLPRDHVLQSHAVLVPLHRNALREEQPEAHTVCNELRRRCSCETCGSLVRRSPFVFAGVIVLLRLRLPLPICSVTRQFLHLQSSRHLGVRLMMRSVCILLLLPPILFLDSLRRHLIIGVADHDYIRAVGIGNRVTVAGLVILVSSIAIESMPVDKYKRLNTATFETQDHASQDGKRETHRQRGLPSGSHTTRSADWP
eukprot:3407832-Rhodomonas_salina.3